MNKIIANHKCSEALRLISAGEMKGLTVLYDCMGKQIFTLALSVVKNYADAEDVMQETFVRITERIKTYRKDGNARAWVMTVTRNVALDTLKRRKQTVAMESAEHLADESDFTEAWELNELLASLDCTDREIIILRISNGFKFKEIGEMVGLSTAATEKRYQRALGKLKTLYEKEK